VAFTVVLAAVGTFLIVKAVDAVIGLRVEQEDESAGLDLSQHGERAYNE
jgi:Amt family ammonium transporter